MSAGHGGGHWAKMVGELLKLGIEHWDSKPAAPSWSATNPKRAPAATTTPKRPQEPPRTRDRVS